MQMILTPKQIKLSIDNDYHIRSYHKFLNNASAIGQLRSRINMRQSKIVQNEWTPLPGRTRNLSPEHKVVVLLSRIFAHKKATPVQKFSAIPTKGKGKAGKYSFRIS